MNKQKIAAEILAAQKSKTPYERIIEKHNLNRSAFYALVKSMGIPPRKRGGLRVKRHSQHDQAVRALWGALESGETYVAISARLGMARSTLHAIATAEGIPTRRAGRGKQPRIEVYDAGTADGVDRYTVFPFIGTVDQNQYLGCSDGGRAVSMWGWLSDADFARRASFLGERVKLINLDKETRDHIISRIKEG